MASTAVQENFSRAKLPVLEFGRWFASREEWDVFGQNALNTFFESGSVLSFPEFEKPRVSVIVVLHNKAHLSLLCLSALIAAAAESFEVIVIDNDSTDQTRRLLGSSSGARIILNDENVGFGQACMQGAADAKGEFLLFLNNDALLQPGAMLAALRNFDDPTVGAVGGKILLANGDLQEAGSIIWSDGSALGYGRSQVATLPQFEFRRPVDYCSAAFLFTPRTLFLKLGGFDPCYSPAYYEDTDYSMKLWQAGFKVIYEPRAVIRHYESASSNGNENAIQRMVEHQKIFVSRWRRQLKTHSAPAPANVLRARIASGFKGLRILYIDDRVPQRHLGSGYPRSNDILTRLVCKGHQITCVAFRFPVNAADKEYCGMPREVELLDFTRDWRTLYRDYLPHADLIWVSRPHNMSMFLDYLLQQHELKAKLVFDAEAIFTERDRIQISLTGRLISPAILSSRHEIEMSLARAADAVVVVSERDAAAFRKGGVNNIHTVGHHLRAIPTGNSFPERSTFLFVGAVHDNENPNYDSMKYFCSEIWPEVRRRTGAEFSIAGYGTDKNLNITQAGVRVLGAVPDLTPLFESARVFVVPTRYAGGIPYKAHEAAAHGVPMVVSDLIGNQLGWTSGVDVLTARDAKEFAAACCEVYQDERLWTKLRINSLTRILTDFDQETFDRGIDGVLESVVV